MIPYQKYTIFLLISIFTQDNLFAKEKLKLALIAGFKSADPRTAEETHRGIDTYLSLHPDFAKELEFKNFDSEGTISGAVAAAKRAKAEGFKIIVGAPKSDEALALAKFSSEQKMILISSLATHPDVTLSRPLTFRVCFTDQLQAQKLAQFASVGLESKNILVLKNLDSKYSQYLSDRFVEILRSLALPPVDAEYVGGMQQQPGLLGDHGGDLRVGVALNHRAEAIVEVDVLVPIDIPDA